MVDKLLKIIAPHHCINCKQIGSALCKSCKNYINDESFLSCIACLRPSNGLCKSCRASYSRAWCVGALDGALKDLLYAYKFENLKSAAEDLTELLDKTIDYLPKDTIITYVPTLPSHIRQRGYDQVALISRKLSKYRNLKHENTLLRSSSTHQRDSTAKQRWLNAKSAYKINKITKGATYLLIDDIVTTGASIEYGAKTLIENGANEVWVAAIARQTLD